MPGGLRGTGRCDRPSSRDSPCPESAPARAARCLVGSASSHGNAAPNEARRSHGERRCVPRIRTQPHNKVIRTPAQAIPERIRTVGHSANYGTPTIHRVLRCMPPSWIHWPVLRTARGRQDPVSQELQPLGQGEAIRPLGLWPDRRSTPRYGLLHAFRCQCAQHDQG
jgi:hypothetical protein